MATPSQIREWLKKMQYRDPNVSDEALQTLCRGAMGPIFQQIVDRVKPVQEVQHIKKAIIINKLIQSDKLRFGYGKSQNQDDIEKLRLYHEKHKLEKQLQEIKAQNIQDEASLEHLKAKIKNKNAKFQKTKEKLKESEKDIVLFKAKIHNLQKQKESCEKLYEQSKILERPNQFEKEVIPEKMTEVLSKLSDLISSYNPQVSPSTPDLTTISENSIVGPLHTSTILSSNKKPLSGIKRSKRANSTRINLADITNNYSLISSTMRKRNLSFIPSFNSTLSPTTSFVMDKSVDSVKELEQLCWSNQQIMNLVDQVWEFDCENVFKLLFDLKIKHKNKIAEMIAQNDNVDKVYDPKSVYGIEKLYAFHIETELKRMICQQEQIKIQKMLNSVDFQGDIMVLKATEFSLETALKHARNNIKKLQQDLPDNSDKLNKISEEIQNIQSEILSVKSKIDTNLCILRESNPWLDKNYKNIFENMKKPQLYSEYELLNSDVAEQDAQNFVSCPFQSQKNNYLNSWAKIYSNPELLEIIQCPYLSPENAVKFFFDQKNWLSQLQLLQKEITNEKLNKSLSQVNVTYNENRMHNSYKKSVELLKASAISCSDTIKRLNDLDTELKYYLESPLNDCVAPNVKFNNTTLKEYCEMFDSYHKQLF